MKRTLALLGGLALMTTGAVAQIGKPVSEVAEIELLPSSEVVEKQQKGFVNVLIVNGDTEARGPHNILAGHTIMSRHTDIDVARSWEIPWSRAGAAHRRRRHRHQRRQQHLRGASPCRPRSSKA